MGNEIHHKSASDLLASLSESSIDLIYTDPPFGTQNEQILSRKKEGLTVSKIGYSDVHEDYLAFLESILKEYHRVLKSTGTLYLHLDYRWAHYAKVSLDKIFGKENFLNEIIWSYDFGGRGKRCWPKKHDTILVYSKEQDKHIFNWDDIPRIPYECPEMQKVGRSLDEAEKRIAAGKVPTDVWNMSILGTASKERTGYPNQKPRKLIDRAILASSNEGQIVLDTFAGSGTTGDSALYNNRKFVMCDQNLESIKIMKERFKNKDVLFFLK